jgi:threonine synthase
MCPFYHSTRGCDEKVTSKQAILEGISPDGGLYISDDVLATKLDASQILAGTRYQDTARTVLAHLLPDFTAEEIDTCVANAYGANFDTPAVAPVKPFGKNAVLELFHGPTSAFKDMALQMLPQLMRVSRAHDAHDVMIVCATSGDTGKAALAGFADVPGTGVTVFYPAGKVSDIQYLQMATQQGDNVSVCAVEGNFDDAQTAVKEIFANRALNEQLGRKNIVLSSANSINVGRLVPQVAYYADAWRQLMASGAISEGEKIDFVVPTGNFGNVLAGYYAKLLGIPIRKLVVASNTNDVLNDFFTTGVYDKRREFHQTISPSMDILVSSNLERLLYLASGGDCAFVAGLMERLGAEGFYRVPDDVMETIRETFSSGRADENQTRAAIKQAWDEYGYLLDPHTAVAAHVLAEQPDDGVLKVVVSTASPYKFSKDVLRSIGIEPEKSGFACMDKLVEATGIPAPKGLSDLRTLPVRFSSVYAIEGMPDCVVDACDEVFA